MIVRLVMWAVMLIGGAVGGWWLDGRLFPLWRTSWILHLVSFVAGLVLLSAVLRVSRNTGRTLARLGREGDHLPRLETNVLATGGLYALMRHPMHLGLLFFPLAIALLVGSPSFILILAPLEMILMIVLIRYGEEPEAIRKFGEAYRAYQKQTPMFCFRPKCLRKLWEKVPPNPQ